MPDESLDNCEAPSEEKREQERPSISLETITFSDGTTLSFENDEIVVFVGPNNAGKSAALRELEEFIARHSEKNVIKDVTLRKEGTADDLKAYLEANAIKSGPIGNASYAGLGYSIHQAHFVYFDGDKDRHPIAPFVCSRLATENRIAASNAAGAIALHEQPAQHAIHQLLVNDELADRVSGIFRRAFGSDLVPFRAGGSKFPLLVGAKPSIAEGEDRLSGTYVKRLRSNTAPLEEQGDGMRSFASVLLYVLATEDKSIQFLDEPEAFLHPPQARLIGEVIAGERRPNSQLFIATHSADILEGLIAGGSNKVRLVRIQREADNNRVKELSKEKTAAIATDTLARYSRVLEGIFYQHVVICEADADCLFYSSLLHTNAISKNQRPDVLFLHASGKHRMAKIAETLRDLDVPISVIADFDLLREQRPLKSLFEVLGGDWSAISRQWNAVKTSIEERRPPSTAANVVAQLNEELEGVSGTDPFPKAKERKIKAILRAISTWDDVKRAGRSALSSGQAVTQFDSLTRACAEVGLWIVPVGELEGFCRDIDGGHGPGFVEKVLDERDLEEDKELEDARRFIGGVWERVQQTTTTPAP